MAFKDVLRKLRKQDGLTQDELASRTGMKRSAISMYERGEREPPFEKLEIFADFFNVDMNQLLDNGKPSTSGITPKEYSLVRSYRKATPADNQIIDYIISRYPLEEI